MLALKFVLLLVLFAINLAGPGLYFARRLRISAGEKFCVAVALSQFIAFLLSFAIYLLNWPSACYWLVTGAGALSLVMVRKDLVALLRNHAVRAQLKAYLAIFIVAFCMLAMIRHYSGGIWAGDWLEHYERTIFFLDHHPKDELFIDQYSLPARPPMMNVLAASYLAQIRDHTFALFSITFLLLNLLVVMPCVMLLTMLGARRIRVSRAVLIYFLAASPMLLQNLTWTWTKLFTAFYVLIALCLYLRGWRKSDRGRIVTAFVALAIAALVHFSAGPYLVVLGIHYAVQFMRRTRKDWREPALAVAASALVLLTWFGWSIHSYGFRETFGSNTSVKLAAASTGSVAARISANVYDTIIPIIWRDPASFEANFAQESRLGSWRDYLFSLYQHNLLLGMGSLAGLVIAILVVRVLTRAPLPHRLTVFWRWFIIGVAILGIAVEGMREPLGCAHLCLQALMLLGVVFLAAQRGKLNVAVRGLLMFCALADFALGVWLQEHIENLDFAASSVLNHRALDSWHLKQMHGLTFLGDKLANFSLLFLIVQLATIGWLLFQALRRVRFSTPRTSKAVC
jgi:hypothetical protein